MQTDILRRMRGVQNLTPPKAPSGPAPVESVEVEVETVTDDDESAEQDPDAAKVAAGYVGADQRCSTCMHHDESGQCGLYLFDCEEDGGCPSHEPGGEPEAGVGMPVASGEEPME